MVDLNAEPEYRSQLVRLRSPYLVIKRGGSNYVMVRRWRFGRLFESHLHTVKKGYVVMISANQSKEFLKLIKTLW